MQIIQTKAALRQAIKKARDSRQSIGFVPTMGFLHEGHLSLMRRARQENDVVVVSVFINPIQFGPNEDLTAYPRDAQRDQNLMQVENVDLAFFPDTEQLYPKDFKTQVAVQGPMAEVMCGTSRPTHFQGVTTVVAKLFNLVTPDRAYFGQKDAQQVAVIEQMSRDLDFGLQVVVCPTVREPDGLAMSSRNSYLSPSQRANAVALSQALFRAREMIGKGERQGAAIVQMIQTHLQAVEKATIDYITVVDAHTLVELESLAGDILVAAAVKFGATRLIDNVRVNLDQIGERSER